MITKTETKKGLYFEAIFKIICACGVIATSLWCCYEFGKNEDFCEISYKMFLQDQQDIYPDVNIITPYQLNTTAFHNLRTGMNSSRVKDSLRGNYWNDKMFKIPLEDVRVKLDSYLISTCVWSSDYEPCNPIEKISYKFLTEGMTSNAFQLPRDKLTTTAVLKFRKSIFSNGISPEDGELTIAFQYPNQLFRSYGSFFEIKWSIDEHDDYQNHAIVFQVKEIEVLQRRRKRDSECLEDDDYDEKNIGNVMMEVGCRPYFWKHGPIDRVCKTEKEVRQIMRRTMEIFKRVKKTKNDKPPCREIQKLQIDKTIISTNWSMIREFNQKGEESMENNGWFEIRLHIQTDIFKEIKQKRAYTLQSLIGNLGGYLGLFAGWSLFGFFNCIFTLYQRARSYIFSKLNI